MVLIKTAQATPETDRELAFGKRWGVHLPGDRCGWQAMNEFKGENFA
jgi:hypothetical protein